MKTKLKAVLAVSLTLALTACGDPDLDEKAQTKLDALSVSAIPFSGGKEDWLCQDYMDHLDKTAKEINSIVNPYMTFTYWLEHNQDLQGVAEYIKSHNVLKQRNMARKISNDCSKLIAKENKFDSEKFIDSIVNYGKKE